MLYQKSIFLFLIFISINLYSQPKDSLYNNDPTQYMPLGMHHAKYHYYADTGLTKIDKQRINPPFWWKGMKNNKLQILLYDQNINKAKVALKNAFGIKLLKVSSVPNPNYLFLDIEISNNAKTGFFDIVLSNNNKTKIYKYELKKRASYDRKGLDNSDIIYMIMPDRFANGDYSNDSYKDMLQQGINRNKMYFRHGGDIQGIIDHLEYINKLGATAIWSTPLLENDQPYASYHGYAITDFYNIDKRFGTNDLYKTYVQKAHNKSIKIIMDIVLNHCGNENWLMRDIPDNNWIHQWPEFTKSNFRSSVIPDPYASDFDKKKLSNGWFDYSMPDLNQENKLLATYLIQNDIWWVEYANIDAYRIDTWFFPNQNFLSKWVNSMKSEYPNLTLFGETWVQNESVQAFFTKNNNSGQNPLFNLPSVTDFQLNFAMEEALTKPQTWTGGVSKLYYTLSQDFLYDNPYQNVIFLDNHDKSRIFTTVGENINKLKSAIGLLLTLRGIPVLYYGTELGFKGDAKPDGNVRQDIRGGWRKDVLNKFTKNGRTKLENEIFKFIKKLANYRKNTIALQTGNLKHFIPDDGIYVYFRYDETKTIMVILNTSSTSKTIGTKKYKEILNKFTNAKNIITDKKINNLSNITVNNNSILILELKTQN